MSARISAGASSIFPDGVRRTSGSRGRIGPRSIPCGLASSFVQRQALGVGAEAVAEGPDAEHEVEQPLGPAALAQRLGDLAGVAPLDRRAGQRHLAADQGPEHELVPGLDVRRRGPGRRRSRRAAG